VQASMDIVKGSASTSVARSWLFVSQAQCMVLRQEIAELIFNIRHRSVCNIISFRRSFFLYLYCWKELHFAHNLSIKMRLSKLH